MAEIIDVISLGAGVQSSALLMMADRGEIKVDGKIVIPKYAIMSDPGNEPEKVYKWLEFLQHQVKNIKIIVTNNGNIVDDILDGIENNERFASVPFFTKKIMPIYKQVPADSQPIEFPDFEDDPEAYIQWMDEGAPTTEVIYKDGEQLGTKVQIGILWRQCTGEYKINAVRKEMRRLYGYGSRDKVKHKFHLWMGISTDEVQRVKPSGVQYIENYFPLIEMNMSRFNCLKWFDDKDLPLPPRSSCIICPYHSNSHWKDMKENDPKSWEMAVEFDKKIRHMPKLDSEVYLHRSCVPLDEVDFGADQLELDLFTSECEGMCGV